MKTTCGIAVSAVETQARRLRHSFETVFRILVARPVHRCVYSRVACPTGVLGRTSIVVATLAVLGAHGAADGQSVEVRISSTEAFVGETLTVQVAVSNMSQQAEPLPPETKDFEIRPDPGNPVGRSQRVSIINGRRTESVDYTYLYEVRPLRTGTLVLPPFVVKDRGLVHHSSQIPIHVSKDTSSAYLFCEVKADKESAYVGQAVDLTLEVWVRQYQQPGIGVLNAETMWDAHVLRDMQATSPGVFGQADWGRIHYREVPRGNEEGVSETYYVYLIETTVYPTMAGLFDFGDVAVVYRYPKRLGRSDSFFSFNRWEVQDSRRLRAVAKTPRLLIKPIPIEGRPADFNGAIGEHVITTSAKPQEVPVGDPITLTLKISGEGPLEQLRPPRLDQVESLTRDFEVSGESLAGEILGKGKRFSQTVRALREDVTEIPPIPFSYFDTNAGRFETAWSEAIPIKVKPAERLALSTLSGPGSSAPVLVPLVESAEGLLANYTDPALLLADQSGTLGTRAWAVLALMPSVYFATWFVRRQAARYRDDEALRRRSRAYSTAKKALKRAGVAASPGQVSDAPPGAADGPPPGEVRNALVGYIADRCNVPAGGLTREDAVRLIAERGVPEPTVRVVDALLGSLELAEYGGQAREAVRDGAASALRLVGELERCKLK
ncbi:MAG: protein BatD [Phycisphaerae bacterium]|nr:protein BatD [Phycisphaerae bacterium]